MKKQRLCANGLPRATGTGQQLYVRNGCTKPPRRGHILCEECRRDAGGYYVRKPVHRESVVNEVKS